MNFWNLLLLEMIKYKTWKIQTHTYIVLWLRKVFRMKGAMLYPVIFIMHTFMVPEQTYASHLPFGVFPVLRGFSVPPAWSLSTGSWELHGRFASAQALSLISEAPVESSPAAHLHVNWPNPNSNLLQPVLPTGSDLTSKQQAVLVLIYFFLWFKFDFIAHKKCQMDSWEEASVLPSPGTERCSGNWKVQLLSQFLNGEGYSQYTVCFRGPSKAGLYQDHQQTQWRLEKKTTDPQVFTT